MGNFNKAVMLGNSNSGICKGRFRRAENGILNGFVLEMYQCGLQLFLSLTLTPGTHWLQQLGQHGFFLLAFFALSLFLQWDSEEFPIWGSSSYLPLTTYFQ